MAAGQQGGLVRADGGEVLAQEMPRSRRQAVHGHVAVVTEVDRIEVGFEYARLGVPAFDQERERRLVDLSPPTPLPLEEERPRQLLGDRAGALPDSALPQVRCERAEHRRDIDAAVLEEPSILGDQHRVYDGPRETLQRAPDLRPAAEAVEDGDLIGPGVEPEGRPVRDEARVGSGTSQPTQAHTPPMTAATTPGDHRPPLDPQRRRFSSRASPCLRSCATASSLPT